MVDKVMFSSAETEWGTPFQLFDILDDEFFFDVDVCASPLNALLDTYYTKEDNALSFSWEANKAYYMNPPYGREISHWVKKARDSAMGGALVVCLIPARTDTKWFWDYCADGEIRLLKGRLKFRSVDGGTITSAPFPSAVVVFYPYLPEANKKIVFWDIDHGK